MSRDTTEKFFAITFLTILAVVIAFLSASGIQDATGRKDWHHFGSIPMGVEQINAKTYLVNKGYAAPSDICSNAALLKAIDQTIPLSDHKVFVRCGRDQTWNDHRARSLNFAGAMRVVIASPLFIIPSALWLAVLSLIWVIPWLKERKTNNYTLRIAQLEGSCDKLAEEVFNSAARIKELEALNSSKCDCGRVTDPGDYLCSACRKETDECQSSSS